MIEAREKAVVRHDKGILLSGLLVFVLVHLGWIDLNLLIEIRKHVYAAIVGSDESWKNAQEDWKLISRDLLPLIEKQESLNLKSLEKVDAEWTRKLLGRLKRVASIPSLQKYESLHIGSDGGISA